MQDVYEHATLNISADAALDSTAGFGTGERLPHGVPVGTTKDRDPVHVRPLFYRTDSSQVSHLPSQKENLIHILATRGWVLQERMLSPRILHFSEYEMAWECDTCCRCECTISPRGSTTRPFRRIVGSSRLSTEEKLKSWSELCQKYSTLNLTRESDKLPAFSGLASRAATLFNKTYIAGVWEEDLPYCLLWYVRDNTDSTRLKEYVPSWSWASIRGAIMTGGLHLRSDSTSPIEYEYDAAVKGIDYKYSGESVYGSLRHGTITIKGKTRQVTFDPQNRVNMETNELTQRTGGDVVSPDVSDWSEFRNANDCLLLIIYEGKPENGSSFHRAMALILRPLKPDPETSPGKKYYRRIGFYRHSRVKGRTKFLDSFQEEEIRLV
jgi:hypothetical protein